MQRVGIQKMREIIPILLEKLHMANEICSAAEFIIPYANGDELTHLLPLLVEQIALRS
jgi:hypothetical protein